MMKLKIHHQGRLVREVELVSGHEYTVGRDAQNKIVLADGAGISRQHLLIREVDQNWVVECKAKSKQLFVAGAQVESCILTSSLVFTIPGYEFQVETIALENSLKMEIGDTGDKTTVGLVPSTPTLVFYDAYGQVDRTISLSGSRSVVGRDPGANIFIDHPKLSRRHFEIYREGNTYSIQDLESANGTFVNGQGLTPGQRYVIQSGDEIAIYDLKMRFVIRDLSFEDRAYEAQRSLAPLNDGFEDEDEYERQQSPPLTLSSEGDGAFAMPQGNPNSEGYQNIDMGGTPLNSPMSGTFDKKNKTQIFRGLIVVVLLLAGVLYFIQQETAPVTGEPKVEKSQTPFDKLSPEQQEVVRQLYKSAQLYLQQAKYELTRQEIIKLHQIIPYYEDSKQIEETANQGLAMLLEKERLAAEEQERKALVEKIRQQIAICRESINERSEMFELDNCLASIVEFDPNHPDILNLRLMVQQIIDARRERELAAKRLQGQIARLQALFDAAKKLEDQKFWLKAIPAYQLVVRSKLPDPRGLKFLAQSRAQEIQAMILAIQDQALKEAETLYAKGDIKGAVTKVREGIVVDESNQILIGRHAEWMVELKNKMRPIFQDSIVEESLGELSAAKSKWNKIIQDSLTGEDYFEKSKVKLMRYGLWN